MPELFASTFPEFSRSCDRRRPFVVIHALAGLGFGAAVFHPAGGAATHLYAGPSPAAALLHLGAGPRTPPVDGHRVIAGPGGPAAGPFTTTGPFLGPALDGAGRDRRAASVHQVPGGWA